MRGMTEFTDEESEVMQCELGAKGVGVGKVKRSGGGGEMEKDGACFGIRVKRVDPGSGLEMGREEPARRVLGHLPE